MQPRLAQSSMGLKTEGAGRADLEKAETLRWTPADVMAYLEERALEPCGPTVPGTILSALGLLESVGGLPKEQRLSLDPVLINFVDGLRKDLETGAPPKKTAQCYSIAMLISAELQVADIQVSLVDRIFSWIFLLMIWTAMRADDVQWLDRRRFCFSELGLRGTLTRSKISGPGRKIRELPVFVHRFANLSGFDWLQIGFDLYEEVSRDFPEDMFITLPHIGGASFSRRYIKVTDFNSWIKAAMAKFRTPKRAEGLWTATEELLLPREMLNFWTGHSPRHCLVSWAAAVGIPAEKRQIVTDIQETVTKAVVTGSPVYNESELLGGRYPMLEEDWIGRGALDEEDLPQQDAVREAIQADLGVNPEIEQGELVASPLDELGNKEEALTMSIQSSVDSSGRLRVTRERKKSKPQDRGMGLSGDAGRFTDRSSFQLATRNMGSPPFSEEQLSELRGEWFKLLPKDPRMARVEEHQPFYLHALAATLREMGDEDHEIIDQHPGDNYVLGRRVGVETPIPRAPLVFRPRLKSQRYDESSFRPISENYSSVQEHEQKIREQFAEEERPTDGLDIMKMTMGNNLSPCWSPKSGGPEAFRVDAKCIRGVITLAGWETTGSQVDQARAEILAAYAGWLGPKATRKPAGLSLLCAGTDNLASEHLSRKRLTTKQPTALILMQLQSSVWDAGFWFETRWRPRSENQEADDLTNKKFDAFLQSLRVELQYEDLGLGLVHELQCHLEALEQDLVHHKTTRDLTQRLTKRAKMETRTEW
ncbi:unnamed protein product [Effrenium voratum]|nr:unnamed protein product [Effrenium voratum]